MNNLLESDLVAKYPQYLQQLENDVKCTSCKYDTVLPVQTVMNCNQGKCVTEMKDQNGLGIDRGNTYQQ